ncbi:unnamed protein product [Phaedon cochleariae]|uniref:DUF4371 domain-containing protein n=1 Tax=Phaedon cochleariae TaxID=80249 RepID=A0A9N9SGD5_PHACE|nr:unnamed protein product [Phaedon cochleariae]
MKRSQNTLDNFIVVKKQKEEEKEIKNDNEKESEGVDYINDIINNQPSTSSTVSKTGDCGNQLRNSSSREMEIEEGEVCMSENDMDAGKVLDHDMITDLQKMNILKYAMVPGKEFIYPFSLHTKKNKDVKCYLSQKHFQLFEWLTFSVSKKGIFCKYCLLFAKYGGQHKQTPLNKLIKTPLCKYSKLLGKDGDLVSHQESSFHKESVINARNFTKNYCDEKNKVINMLDTERREQIIENRKRLTSIIESIIFLGRQNIPLRGHRDSGAIVIKSSETEDIDLDVESSPTANEGNFRELLRFRVESGDTVLKEHLKNSSSKATYISAKTRNELIEYCKEEIITTILKRITECKYYCIIFDETTDVSHISQMSVTLRYVSKNQIFEDFVGFINCHASNYNEPSIEPVMTGKILAQTVVKLMKYLNLNMDHCVGIGTDGCNLMLGEQKGAVKELQQELKNALKCPCSNHALNLSISKSSNVQSIRNATGIMKEVITFFNSSSKRHSVLLHVNGKNLKKLCDTRERDSASKAACLKLSLISTNFITKTIDNLYAEKIITNVLQTLQYKREKGDDNFNKIYKDITKIHEMLEIDITMPRVMQQKRPTRQKIRKKLRIHYNPGSSEPESAASSPAQKNFEL